MSEVKIPTDAEKMATANVLKNIQEILKRGLFFGENAGYVHEALIWLEKCAQDMTPVPIAPTPEETIVPDLKIVPDLVVEEAPQDGQG